MEIAFDAIGIEIANQAAFDNLAETVGVRGELTKIPRDAGVLHGRCLKLGAGLEVWSVRYESDSGELFPADCRPAFRARYAQKIAPWLMTEFDREGEATVHGFIENSEAEVLFELQNITEIGSQILDYKILNVGLCGLAYRAEICAKVEKPFWKDCGDQNADENLSENDWNLCGTVIEFDAVRNALSGNDLYWIYLDTGEFKLEILVNQRTLNGKKLKIGASLKADIWLQGHVLSEKAGRGLYEGVDRTTRTPDFWKHFKRLN